MTRCGGGSGANNLFMDVDSLRPGEDWVDAVEAAVVRCDVLLAIIGPTWAVAKDSEGRIPPPQRARSGPPGD
jgi:hypothetical protein